MTLAFSSAATRHQANQAFEGRDQIGFWLSALTLCLLPLERLMLPMHLTLADLTLMSLTLYGLGRAWYTRQRLDFPLILPLWVILFSSLVATLVGSAHPDSVIAILQEIYLFTWFIVLTNVLKMFSWSDLDRLLKVWSVIACVEAGTTLMGMLRIGPSMFYTRPFHEQDATTVELIRAVGTYVNSNAVAVYLSVSFFVLLATTWPIWLRSVLGLWLYAGMFGTGSNGALLSTLIGLVILVAVYLITKSGREILLWAAIISIGAGIMAAALFIIFGLSPSLVPGLDASGQTLFSTLGRLSHSFTTRLDIIGWAWKTYSRYPWGTGPNSFASLGGSLHNDYAAFWFERGPLGALGWLGLIGTTLLAPLRAANQPANKERCWQVLAPGAGFLACMINAFSHEVSHMRQVWLLMVFLFALSYAQQQATCSSNSTEVVGKGNLV